MAGARFTRERRRGQNVTARAALALLFGVLAVGWYPGDAAAAQAAGAVAADEAILKATVGLPFDEVELIVRTELQVRNVNIIGTLDVQQALKNRDVSFPKYRAIQFCNLQDGLVLFKENPDYGVFIPCSILIYERDGKTVLASRRPTAIVRGLPGHTPSPEAAAVAERVEVLVREVLGAVVEEARAQGK